MLLPDKISFLLSNDKELNGKELMVHEIHADENYMLTFLLIKSFKIVPFGG